MCPEIGSRESELIYLSNLAGARLGLGQFPEAEASLREVIGAATSPNACSRRKLLVSFEACSGQGKYAEAWDAAQKRWH
jgi:hypothetical protein